MDVQGHVAVGLQVLGKLLGRPAVAGLGIEGCQHVLGLQFAVEVAAVLGQELVGPRLEVLAHRSPVMRPKKKS